MSVIADRAEKAITAALEDEGETLDSSEMEGELSTAAAPSEPAAQDEPEYVDEDEAAPTEQAEVETEAQADPEKWYDEGVLTRAASYGFSEDQLKEYRDQAEFDRYTRFLDQQFAAYQQAQQTDLTRAAPSSTQQGSAEKQAPAAPIPGIKDGLIDLDYVNEKFEDEDTRTLFQAINHALKSRDDLVTKSADQLQQLHSIIKEQAEIKAENDFHDALDRYNADFYGNSAEPDGVGWYKPLPTDKEQLRGEVMDALKSTILPYVENESKRNPQYQRPSMDVLVQRAAKLVHLDKLEKASNEKKAAALKSQSNKRRPVVQPSSTSKVPLRAPKDDRPLTVNEEAEEIANDPEVKALWQKFQEENGVAV